VNTIARIAAGTAAVGTATIAYAAVIERRHWNPAQLTIPVLSANARRMRVLHISDLHMLPGQNANSAGCGHWRTGSGPGGEHRRQPRPPTGVPP